MRLPGVARAGLNSIPGVSLDPPAGELPSASLFEDAAFNALVIVPNALQGIFRRRPKVVTGATRANVDRRGVGLLRGMRRGYDGSPVWVRVVTDRALLLLSAEDVRRALEGAPRPFAADPEAKRRGMSHFQPDALTISRGELWGSRRRFTEAVLDTPEPLHRHAESFRSAIGEETGALLAEIETEAGGELDWDRFNRCVRRIARRIILGDGARDDDEVSELLGTLMDEANGLPKERSERFAPFMAKVGSYVEEAEPGSLVSLFAEAPADAETRPEGQVPHWLFALGDTLAINAYRALALIASHPPQRASVREELEAAGDDGAGTVAGLEYLGACLQEAMRLWPTTPLLSRETLEPTEWNGVVVPAGTQLLIVNVFFHRDPDRHRFADRFAPEQWTEGGAADDWSFNHFSHGPQGCPGAYLALFTGKKLLADLLTRGEVSLREPKLDPDRPLPHMLNFFSLRFGVTSASSKR